MAGFDFGSMSSGLGSVLDSVLSFGSSKKEASRQRRVMQQQIQWRVADAQKAGIHPLYAMGITPSMHSPSMVGSDFSSAGQDISRAMSANLDRKERAEASRIALETAAQNNIRENEAHKMSMERAGLENALLRSQVARANSAQVGPGVPSHRPRSVAPGTAVTVPSEVISPSVGNPARQAGTITDYQFVRRADGGLGVVRSQDMADRLDDDVIGSAEWQFRNNIMPRLTGRGMSAPPASEYPLMDGYYWHYDQVRGAFYPRRLRTARRARPSFSQRPGNF